MQSYQHQISSDSLAVAVSDIGAGIRSVHLKKGPFASKNVVLSFLHTQDYFHNPLYAGATLAPSAGRVKNGAVCLGGSMIQLSKNENHRTHLHGGSHPLSFRRWETLQLTASDALFRASLPDGLDGYPGNRMFFTAYSITGCRLNISYRMESDRPTYVNISNHAYFNLNGFSAGAKTSGLEQYFCTTAAQAVYNDEEHIPVRLTDVENTPFDFSDYRLIKDNVNTFAAHPQLRTARGYNHYFLVGETSGAAACSLLSFDKRLEMRVFTDAPAFVLYTGGFIDHSNRLLTDDGSALSTSPGCAVAIEPSSLPLPLFPAEGHMVWERCIVLEWIY